MNALLLPYLWVQLRLTVSGSAACPTPIMQRWEQLSGKCLSLTGAVWLYWSAAGLWFVASGS
jgi:hypothetical protein